MSCYTAEDLAQLAGLTARTVRYYVAEKLISPPHGRGRGAHFDEGHLAQLNRIRFLQSSGLDHRQIREHRDEMRVVLASRGRSLDEIEKIWVHHGEQALAAGRRAADRQVDPTVSRITRIEVLPGLELAVSDDYRLPSPGQVAELAVVIARAFPAKPRR